MPPSLSLIWKILLGVLYEWGPGYEIRAQRRAAKMIRELRSSVRVELAPIHRPVRHDWERFSTWFEELKRLVPTK